MIIECQGKEYLIPNKAVELFEKYYSPIQEFKDNAPYLLHKDMSFIQELLKLEH